MAGGEKKKPLPESWLSSYSFSVGQAADTGVAWRGVAWRGAAPRLEEIAAEFS